MTNDRPDGIHPNVTRAEYDAVLAVNHSRLKRMGRSPMHCREGGSSESDAMRLGTLVHAYILEAERFRRAHVVLPDLTVGLLNEKGESYANPKATKQYKARLSAFGQEHRGKAFVDAEDWAICERIGEAIAGHATATDILMAEADAEVMVLWTDPATGIRCKALVDHLTRLDRRATDLKTTTDASPGPFARACAAFSYHSQAAWYLWGLSAVGRPAWSFAHIAVETEPPHGVAVYELDDQALDQGLRLCRAWLDRYASCDRAGRWPGYPDSVQSITLPKWAITPEGA